MLRRISCIGRDRVELLTWHKTTIVKDQIRQAAWQVSTTSPASRWSLTFWRLHALSASRLSLSRQTPPSIERSLTEDAGSLTPDWKTGEDLASVFSSGPISGRRWHAFVATMFSCPKVREFWVR